MNEEDIKDIIQTTIKQEKIKAKHAMKIREHIEHIIEEIGFTIKCIYFPNDIMDNLISYTEKGSSFGLTTTKRHSKGDKEIGDNDFLIEISVINNTFYLTGKIDPSKLWIF